MTLHTIPCNPFQENCYLLTTATTAIVIDCGVYFDYEQARISQAIGDRQVYHLSTHCHLDHQFGARWLYEQYGALPHIHPADGAMLSQLAQQASLFGIPYPGQPLTEYVPLPDTGEMLLGELRIRIIETPGHTPGGVCYLIEDTTTVEPPVLFSGDTLFMGGYGRTDLPGGDYTQLMASLTRIQRLPEQLHIDPHTIVYPGHGYSTTIDDERGCL